MTETAKRLFVSFSGGETSGYMTYQILKHWYRRWDEIVVGFANTGAENEETLEFVDRCDREFGFKTVWLEAVISPEKGEGTRHRIVDFKTASRNAEPFREAIKKYGIPNAKYPFCTRELKLNPMKSFLRSMGWENGTYDTAIGIRADEAKRRAKGHIEARIIYLLMDLLPTTKPGINRWWAVQPFRLELMGHEGNCKWCWKKSLRKLLAIMAMHPEKFDFPEEMDALYSLVGPEFGKPETAPGYKRVFFRGNLSTADLRKLCTENTLDLPANDAVAFPMTGELFPLDVEPGGCTETCEVDFAEAA